VKKFGGELERFRAACWKRGGRSKYQRRRRPRRLFRKPLKHIRLLESFREGALQAELEQGSLQDLQSLHLGTLAALLAKLPGNAQDSRRLG